MSDLARQAYSIAGISIELEFDDSPAAAVLRHELRHYPRSTVRAEMKIRMASYPGPTLFANPEFHLEHENGFSARAAHATTTWIADAEAPTVYFDVSRRGKRLGSKLRGMQFTHPFEEVGQIFHEVCLIPSLCLFFPERIIPAHGSSFEARNGSGVLISGTGGVGKTSTELELIRNHGFRFLADDITLIASSGWLHPNFAFPKIYGYNVQGDGELEDAVFAGRDRIDRGWWKVQQILRSPTLIRRRVDPETFYNGSTSGGGHLALVIFLMRSAVSAIEVRDISAATAAAMSTAVLRTELGLLWNHLAWHEFNRGPNGGLLWRAEQIMQTWVKAKNDVFANCRRAAVMLPAGYRAHDVRYAMPQVIERLLNESRSTDVDGGA